MAVVWISLPCPTPLLRSSQGPACLVPWPLLPRTCLMAASGTHPRVSFRSLMYQLIIKQDQVLPAAAAPLSTITEQGRWADLNFLIQVLQPMQIRQLSTSNLQVWTGRVGSTLSATFFLWTIKPGLSRTLPALSGCRPGYLRAKSVRVLTLLEGVPLLSVLPYRGL